MSTDRDATATWLSQDAHDRLKAELEGSVSDSDEWSDRDTSDYDSELWEDEALALC